MVVVNFTPPRAPDSIICPLPEPEKTSKAPKMTARASLICRPNSHPFADRHLVLDQQIKVGRSVARARPAANNAIFDCKVLSRNHALLWYENGKFYLQDTKSSNGTFINNQRLSKGSEESAPREMCSGDIVQFGVDVMENSRKVTHGCIIATLKLYLPDGKEAKAGPSTAVNNNQIASLPTPDLYQLHMYLQEAMQREQLLENKLATLQRLVNSTQEASESGWKALIDEDRLLSRVEILEGQLHTMAKGCSEDKLREELKRLQEEKVTYQNTAKESLRKVLQEKLDAIRRLQDAERSLSNTEDECAILKESHDKVEQELKLLAEKFEKKEDELKKLGEKVELKEEEKKEEQEKLEQEKRELENQLTEKSEEGKKLLAQLESAHAENDFAKQQLSSFRSKVDAENLASPKIDALKETDTQGTQVDIILERIDAEMNGDLKGALEQSQNEMMNLKDQLQKSRDELILSNNRVDELNTQLLNSQQEGTTHSTRIVELQGEIQKLTEQINQQQNSIEVTPSDLNATLQAEKSEAQCNGDLKLELERLEDLLHESRHKKEKLEDEMKGIRQELDVAQQNVQKSSNEIITLRTQLQVAQAQAREKAEYVSGLQEQVGRLESSAHDVKQQILTLKDRLVEEQQRCKLRSEENDTLRKQLQEAQQNAKQSHNEAEQLRNRLRTFPVDDGHRLHNGDNSWLVDNRGREELENLRTECANLRTRITALEKDKKRTEDEHVELKVQYKCLQETYTKLESEQQTDVTTNIRRREKYLSDEQRNRSISEKDVELTKESFDTVRKQDLDSYSGLEEEYNLLASHSKTLTCCVIVPIFVLVMSFILAFYPMVSSLTGGRETPRDNH